jgi:hypothetical protein
MTVRMASSRVPWVSAIEYGTLTVPDQPASGVKTTTPELFTTNVP